MMGIEVARQRDMMEESFEAILELLDGEKPVNRTTDWFTLRDARLQLRPYSDPCFEIAVAAQVSPSGPRLAGRFGQSLLSIGATSQGGFDILGAHWDVMEERAAEFGTTGRPPQVAPRRPDAHRRHQGAGLRGRAVRPAPVGRLLPARRRPPPRPRHHDANEMADAMNASGFAVIGTVDDAIAQIQRLIDQSGGFGTFLNMAHEWADRPAHLAQLRADGPLRVPALPGLGRVHDRQPRLGGREPARVHQRRHHRHHDGGPVPPPGEGREGRQTTDHQPTSVNRYGRHAAVSVHRRWLLALDERGGDDRGGHGLAADVDGHLAPLLHLGRQEGQGDAVAEHR